MFLLTLLVQAESGLEMTLRGQISGAGEGAQPDFNVSCRMANGSWVRGVLAAHHRWSEPVQEFIARALAAVPRASEGPNGGSLVKLSTLKLSVRDFRRGRRLVAEVVVPCEGQPEVSPSDLWSLAAQQCVLDAFGQSECPAPTGPLLPTIHESGKGAERSRYVRAVELPAQVQMATSWVLGKRFRPTDVPEPDAISAEAFDAFLRNEVEIPRPALGWLWP
jgi:hypothetical protein